MQALLERYVRVRATRLLPYIRALATNVSTLGVPTMRPLAYEFPLDSGAAAVNDQYMLGPDLLVAPVTVQGATTRLVTFPGDATTRWVSFWDARAPHACFFATRDISMNEELGYRRDKNAFTAKSRKGSIKCLCGASACMGFV